ncbi:hypothetical protein RS030_162565 [Cryptosporidium xiaoi]|uniref:Uncharacterized protein n=1 Tax=Cryptosporidium xiaoi TaxID=659607 RepID=A0AAV9Y0C9_9CRYT
MEYSNLLVKGTSTLDFENNINEILRGRVYIMQNNIKPMTLIFSSKVYPQSYIEENEDLGFLESSSENREFFIAQNKEKVQLTSPCRAVVEQIYTNSGSVLVADNINGSISPKYILSLICKELPQNSILSSRKKKEMDKLILSVELSSRENAIITDVPDTEQIEQDNVVLGMWFNDYTYVRYEALSKLNNVISLYDKSQMIGQKFNRGLGLIKFEVEITPVMAGAELDYQKQIYDVTQLQDTGLPQVFQTDQTISPETVYNENNFEIQNKGDSIEQIDKKSDVEENKSKKKRYKNEVENSRDTEEYDDYGKKEDKKNEEEDDTIRNALLNAAATYSIITENKMKKDKLHKITNISGLMDPGNTKWIVRSPCSGVLMTNILEDEPGQKIEQGTLFATVKCNKSKKKSRDKNRELEDLIMPFSIKVTNIKIRLEESESNDSFNSEDGTLYSKVMKNERILSGKLINESKHVPSYLIYGNYQLITSPCQGRMSINKDVGNSVRGREKVFKVRCKNKKDDNYDKNDTAYGKSVKSGLVAHYFKEHHSVVKTGEAVAIIRNNWRVLASPCDGLLIYTDSPGLARSGTNIAIVICNDNKLKRKKIQATKSFMILATLLPNPSVVRKKQPIVIVDTSELNWEGSKDDIEESDDESEIENVTKTIFPIKEMNNVENTEKIIQDIISPCNGNLLRHFNHKIGAKIKEKNIITQIKCDDNKIYTFIAGKNIVILQDSVYRKNNETEGEKENVSNSSLSEVQISKGETLLQILFIHNIKYYVIKAPCTGYGYTLSSKGKKINKGKYFAVIQCKDGEKEYTTQKIRAIKDMEIISTYMSLKKKFLKGEPLFITIQQPTL